MRFVHTNIIANDWKRLSQFYQRVFGCRPVPPRRDLKGDWLDNLTGVKNAHITGEHLVLPGYEKNLPTLEIFSYDDNVCGEDKPITRAGFAHIAFEVSDIEALMELILQEGGGQLGDIVSTEYPGGVTASFVYATDLEGNIIELQSWKK